MTRKAIIFDTETTSLFDHSAPADAPGQPRMCSIAATLVGESGVTLKTMFRLIKPEGWSEFIIKKAQDPVDGGFAINGLSMEILEKEGVPVADALAEFDAMTDEAGGISAFNIVFDQKVYRGESRIAGRDDRYGYRPTFCLMQGARPLCALKKAPRLEEAVKIILGRDLPGKHNAEVDCAAAVDIYRHMLAMPNFINWKPQVSKVKPQAATAKNEA